MNLLELSKFCYIDFDWAGPGTLCMYPHHMNDVTPAWLTAKPMVLSLDVNFLSIRTR